MQREVYVISKYKHLYVPKLRTVRCAGLLMQGAQVGPRQEMPNLDDLFTLLGGV
jgi:hypothetical protein